MPIYLDRDLPSHKTDPAIRSIDIGLVNNMPDGALKTTERQFIRLLDSAAEGMLVRLSFYALPEIPRADWGRQHIGSFYSSLDMLWNRRLDGLIMTGCEPHASNLRDEPYWGSMTKVIDWAEQNTTSAVWSCLAAHAAVLHGDRVARRRLDQKRCGVFRCSPVANHPLTASLPSPFSVPHSRWNDLPEDELTTRGYQILTRTEEAGVDTFIKQKKSLFLFLQGHPEYETQTLLHEYRRDVRRYLRRESDTYPEIPRRYLDREGMDALTAFEGRAVCDRRDELLADFPTLFDGTNLANSWCPAAVRMYRNWIRYLCARKDQLVKKGWYRSELVWQQELVARHHVAAVN